MKPATSRPESLWRSAALLTASGLLFAAMGVLIRTASAEVNNETIVFLRNLTGFLLFLPLLLWRGVRPFTTRRPGLHLFRALVGLAAMYCFFFAIAHIPLAEAMLFTYAAPVFVPLVSRLWLGEPLHARTLLAVGIGLVGVLLVLKPGADLFRPLSLVGLAACVLAAIAFVSVRHLTETEPAVRVVFWFATISTLVSAVPMAWAWEGLSGYNLGLLIGVGLLATASQLVMSEGYRLAPAGKASPFGYSAIVFSALFAWLLWDERIDALAATGAGLVFAATLVALRGARREARRSVGV